MSLLMVSQHLRLDSCASVDENKSVSTLLSIREYLCYTLYCSFTVPLWNIAQMGDIQQSDIQGEIIKSLPAAILQSHDAIVPLIEATVLRLFDARIMPEITRHWQTQRNELNSVDSHLREVENDYREMRDGQKALNATLSKLNDMLNVMSNELGQILVNDTSQNERMTKHSQRIVIVESAIASLPEIKAELRGLAIEVRGDPTNPDRMTIYKMIAQNNQRHADDMNELKAVLSKLVENKEVTDARLTAIDNYIQSQKAWVGRVAAAGKWLVNNPKWVLAIAGAGGGIPVLIEFVKALTGW